jgi:hypothetical protein
MTSSENERASEKKSSESARHIHQTIKVEAVVAQLRIAIAARGWHVPVGINLEHRLVMIGRPFPGKSQYTRRIYTFDSIYAMIAPIECLMSDIQAMHDKLYTLAWQERQIKETRERYGSRKATDDGPTEERI